VQRFASPFVSAKQVDPRGAWESTFAALLRGENVDVAGLVANLIPLLGDPARNSDAILSLLLRHRDLADYEVARFLVAKRSEPVVRELMASVDPRMRRDAVRWVELTYARSPAARFLRDAMNDRSRIVRRAANGATRSLRIDDVALPDERLTVRPIPERRGINPFTKQPVVFPGRPASAPKVLRGYDPTGWSFGLHRDWSVVKRPTPALAALDDRADVEALLGVSTDELTPLLRPGAGPGCAYVAFEIPKATGGVRTLHAPRQPLKKIQRALLEKLLDPIAAHPAAHGFVRGRSIVTNAKPHVGAAVVVKMDLADFFPTIHFGRLVGLFEHYGAGRAAARALSAIVSFRPKLPDGRVAWPSVLPQGAPTSPAISNLVCRRMDARLTALATKVGAKYTRYADDLTFSFVEEPGSLGRFFWWVDQIVGQEGFIENRRKRRVLRPGGGARITGLVTAPGLAVPREARRRFRAVLDHCRKLGVTKEATRHEEPRAYLLGFVSYVAMVQPELGAALRAEVLALLGERETEDA
jgi:RNA-directed DNA polymerase